MKALQCTSQAFSLFNSRFVFANGPGVPKNLEQDSSREKEVQKGKEESNQMEGLDLRTPEQRAKDSAKDYTDAVAELEASLANKEPRKLDLGLPKKPAEAPTAIAKKSSAKGPEIVKK